VLQIPYPDETLLLDEITQLSKTSEQGVLKIILTRGSGGRGYRQPDLLKPTRIIALHPFPDFLDNMLIQVQHQPFLKLILPFGTGKHLFQAVIMFQACKQRV
jgi:hypothetical protein